MKAINCFLKYVIVIAAFVALTGCGEVGEQLVESVLGSKTVKAKFEADSPKGTVKTIKAMSYDGMAVYDEIISAPYSESAFQLTLLHPVASTLLKENALIGLIIFAEGLVEGETVTISPEEAVYNSIAIRFVAFDDAGNEVDKAYCVRKSDGKLTEYDWVYCDTEVTVKSKNLDMKFEKGWNIVAGTDIVQYKTIDKLPSDVRWVFSDEFVKLRE